MIDGHGHRARSADIGGNPGLGLVCYVVTEWLFCLRSLPAGRAGPRSLRHRHLDCVARACRRRHADRFAVRDQHGGAAGIVD
jgi:hypothetical protein